MTLYWPKIDHHPSSLSTTNHTTFFNSFLCCCENSHVVPSLNTARQLITPTNATYYNLNQEQLLGNHITLINNDISVVNSSPKLEEMAELNDRNSCSKSNRKYSDETVTKMNVKLCTCSKRKLSDIYMPTPQLDSSSENKLFEEFHVSNSSLQLMDSEDLFYTHDLALRNASQFYQILSEHYHLSKNQINLFADVMNNWWEKH